MSKNAHWFGNGKNEARGAQKVYLANVWYSWNKFIDTIHQVLKTEWINKQEDICGYCSHISHIFEYLSIKLLLISAIPLLIYLSIFKSYHFFKETVGLPKDPHLFLPVIEYNIFNCLPHQVLSRLSTPILDGLAAFPYVIHFILPVLFIAYNVITRRREAVPLIYQYLWCVGWTNVVAVIIQFTIPTAPPWFNDTAVFDETTGKVISSMPNEAAFQRIDAMLGIPWFKSIYGQSPLKFGSFPSLHVAWPMVIFLHRPWFNYKVGLFHVVWITWAALYSSHHYLIDALGGILLVIAVKLGMMLVWEPFTSLERRSPKDPSSACPQRSYHRLSSISKAV